MNTYQITNTVTTRATMQVETLPHVTPTTFAPYDPTTVTCTTLAPDGTTVTYTYGVDAALAKEAPGQYACQFLVNQIGLWSYRWKGISAASSGTQEGYVWVTATKIP